MKPLDIRFPKTKDLKIDELANQTELNKSDLGRIALSWGLEKLTAVISNKNEVTDDFLKLEALKAKQ